MSSNAVTAVKSALISGWRERWSDEQWSVAVRKHIPRGTSGDACQLAEILLEQALIGPSPNMHLMSYLQHAVSTQMVTCGSVISVLTRYTDVNRGYCVMSLLQFTAETLTPCLSMLDDSINGTSLSVGKSVLSLVLWLLSITLKSIQRQTISSPAVDKIFGLSSDTAVPPTVLINKVCEVIQQVLSTKSLNALGQIACYEDADLTMHLKQLVVEINSSKIHVTDNESKTNIIQVLNSVTRLIEMPSLSGVSLDLSSHLLNISINVFVNFEAMLSPTNDARILAQLLQLLQASQGLSDADLYVELVRSSLMGITNIVGRPDELKWAAFTFLKLPNIIHQLVSMANSGSESGEDFSLWQALVKLLNYVSLLDLADSKCKCDCLQYLLHEFSNKYSLLSEEQCQQLHNKRKNESLKPFDVESIGGPASGGQQPTTFLVLRAEPTVNSIFNTLRVDYSKNLEGVLGILCQMISGKSFELILSAAAVTGKLPSLIVELIKFNEMAKVASGEGSKGALNRSLLFDISFLMLCHIIQLYGLEVISMNSEYSTSFIIQWGVHCLPEDGKFKSVEILSSGDSAKVEMLLGQLGSTGSELKLTLTRWHEVCSNIPYVVQDVLLAWHAGTIGVDQVTVILDNIKSSMCCLPIIVSAWLCSFINVSDGETRQKALFMLQHLKTPLSSESSVQYYNERSHLMHVILCKMVQGLLSSSSSPQLSSVTELSTENATREKLVSTQKTILNRGCITADEVHKMDSLLNVGGPAWYSEHLVRTLLLYDRPEDLHQAVGLVYSLFHADINNLTLCLLNTTLPRLLLLQSGTTACSTNSTTSSLKLLTDPRGSALAKLCIMCINLAYTTRHITNNSTSGTSDSSNIYRGRKRTRAEAQIEEWNSGDDDEDCENNIDDRDWSESDGVLDDTRISSRLLRHTFSEDMSDINVLPQSSSVDDAFELQVPEFLTTPTGVSANRRNDLRPSFDSKDLLSKSLLRLFRLMQSIMSDKLVSPRSAFIVSFVKEAIKTNQATARYILHFLPYSMVNSFVRTLPNEFCPEMLLAMCDLRTSAGRRTAAKAVSQQARYSAITASTHR